MMISAPIDTDQFVDGINIEFEVFGYFYDHGYPVESIIEAHSVVNKKQDDEDTGHLVLKIETLSKPLDEADVAVDACSIFVCDCKGYQYHYDVPLEEKSITEWDACPHIKEVAPHLKAIDDEQQTRL